MYVSETESMNLVNFSEAELTLTTALTPERFLAFDLDKHVFMNLIFSRVT